MDVQSDKAGADDSALSEDEQILTLAQELYDIDKSHWDELVYNPAKQDLHFLSDEPGAQWDADAYEARKRSGQSTVQIDYLTQYVHQIVNEERQQEKEADVVPIGSQASKDTAKIIKGLLKKIEYDSRADHAYETAGDFAVKCSIGYIKVDHDYENEQDGWEQCLQIKRIINPFVIYPDCTFIEPDGSDMRHCTEIEKMSVREFKDRWPNHAVADFDSKEDRKTGHEDSEEISIAHFYIRSSEEQELKSPDGKKSRTVKKYTIERYKLSGVEVLEKTTFPGKFIPYVPVLGEEAWEDGERKIYSLIRKSKSAQAQYNLMQSINTDILLKQPQAPVMTPFEAIGPYMDIWKNPSKSMALPYDVYDAEGRQLPPPERLAPPQVSSGLVEAMNNSINDIRGTLGMYQASVGQQGPETSGIAINARKIEGDTANYHFGDNLVRSMTHVSRILVGAMPAIYDTRRIIQIINDEDAAELVGINGLTVEGQQALHDFKTGSYDVRVTVGASFTTQRQQAEAFLKDFLTRNPQYLNVFGDLFFKFADFAGASELEARMQKVMPPQLTAQGGDPQVMALMQQLQQAQQVIQQLKSALQEKQTDQQIKMAQIQSKHEQAETGHQLSLVKHVGDLSLQDRKLDIQEQKNAIDAVLGAGQLHQNNIANRIKQVERQTLPNGNPQANQGGGF